MCALTMLRNLENNGIEEIGLVTPTPDHTSEPLAKSFKRCRCKILQI